MRHPTAATNSAVYNDLALLEEQLERAAATAAQRAAEEADKPMPKTNKYYKELKEKKAKSRELSALAPVAGRRRRSWSKQRSMSEDTDSARRRPLLAGHGRSRRRHLRLGHRRQPLDWTSPPASPSSTPATAIPRVVEAIQEQAGKIIHAQQNILAHEPMMQGRRRADRDAAGSPQPGLLGQQRRRGDRGRDQAGQGRHRTARR